MVSGGAVLSALAPGALAAVSNGRPASSFGKGDIGILNYALFTVTTRGDATVGVPGSIAGVKLIMVTSEPLGGSRVPTTSPVIVAHVS
jgi:hypothetical protein